jgi:hypothetical protein
MLNRSLPLVLALAAAVAAPLGAQAQPAPSGDHADRRAEMQARHEQRRQQEAHDLAIVLRLKPAQQTALNAMLDAAHPPRRERKPEVAEPMTTPEKLDAAAARQAEFAAMSKRRSDAVRAFYATLDPSQREVFDALMRLRAAHGPHGWRGGHEGPKMGFGGPPG